VGVWVAAVEYIHGTRHALVSLTHVFALQALPGCIARLGARIADGNRVRHHDCSGEPLTAGPAVEPRAAAASIIGATFTARCASRAV
jgi:hypothetical protein